MENAPAQDSFKEVPLAQEPDPLGANGYGSPGAHSLSTPWRVNFMGRGDAFFGIFITNVFLSLITVGLYWPWAKAARLRFLWQETEFGGSRFTFHGTGRELFVGMIKALVIFGVIYLAQIVLNTTTTTVLRFTAGVVVLAGFFLVPPLAIYGALRYRLSRTSWRGIHAGYRGTLGALLRIQLKGILLSGLTLGIYLPWFWAERYREIMSNIRLGSVRFHFRGTGRDLFKIYLPYLIVVAVMVVMGIVAGIAVFASLHGGGSGGAAALVGLIVLIYLVIFACYIALAVLYFRTATLSQRYIVNHLEIEHQGMFYPMRSTVNVWKVVEVKLVNWLLMAVTLGLAWPYVTIRNLKLWMDTTEIDGTLDPDGIVQTEEDFRDASGDDMVTLFDIEV